MNMNAHDVLMIVATTDLALISGRDDFIKEASDLFKELGDDNSLDSASGLFFDVTNYSLAGAFYHHSKYDNDDGRSMKVLSAMVQRHMDQYLKDKAKTTSGYDNGLYVDTLINKLEPHRGKRIMIMDGFNGGGHPREINSGPKLYTINNDDENETADCEELVGETVVVIGYGSY